MSENSSSASVEYNMVDHPVHYTDNSSVIEPIDVCEYLDFCRGNAIKYVCRYKSKNPDNIIEDLKKALWYIERSMSHPSDGSLDLPTWIDALLYIFCLKSKNSLLLQAIEGFESIYYMNLGDFFKNLRDLIKEELDHLEKLEEISVKDKVDSIAKYASTLERNSHFS